MSNNPPPPPRLPHVELCCSRHLSHPTPKKALTATLLELHIKSAANRTGFDNVTLEKDRSLLFVLHGPPRVGKTLTVEAIAEQTRRPLYALSDGELGSTPRGTLHCSPTNSRTGNVIKSRA